MVPVQQGEGQQVDGCHGEGDVEHRASTHGEQAGQLSGPGGREEREEPGARQQIGDLRGGEKDWVSGRRGSQGWMKRAGALRGEGKGWAFSWY